MQKKNNFPRVIDSKNHALKTTAKIILYCWQHRVVPGFNLSREPDDTDKASVRAVPAAVLTIIHTDAGSLLSTLLICHCSYSTTRHKDGGGRKRKVDKWNQTLALDVQTDTPPVCPPRAVRPSMIRFHWNPQHFDVINSRCHFRHF